MTAAEEWAAYHAAPTLERRNVLVVRYRGLPARIVAAMFKGAVRAGDQNYVNHDDLAAAGVVGLIKGVEAYDPSRGASPETWLGHRIRSAVLDECRRLDHLSRADRKAAGRSDDGFDFQALREKGIAPEKAARIVRGERMGSALPFSRLETTRPITGPSVHADCDSDLLEAWRAMFAGLKFQQALALVLHHFEGFSARRIAVTLGLKDRPAWLRKILKNTSVPPNPLGSSGYTSCRYRWHAEKRPVMQAFLRKRPRARSENCPILTRSGPHA